MKSETLKKIISQGEGINSENRIFPYADMDELEDELFTRVRKTVGNMRPDHPWSSMDNIDMLKSAGMYLKDQITGEQGITLDDAVCI